MRFSIPFVLATIAAVALPAFAAPTYSNDDLVACVWQYSTHTLWLTYLSFVAVIMMTSSAVKKLSYSSESSLNALLMKL